MDWARFFASVLREYLMSSESVLQDTPFIQWVESDSGARPALPLDTIIRPEPPEVRDPRWGFEAYMGETKVRVLGLGLHNYFLRVLREGRVVQVSPKSLRLPSGESLAFLTEDEPYDSSPPKVNPEMLWYHQRYGIVEELKRDSDWVTIRLLEGDAQELEDRVVFDLNDSDKLFPLELSPERTVHQSELIEFDSLKPLKAEDGVWIAYSLPVEDDIMTTEEGFLRVVVELTPVFRDEVHDPYVYALCVDENNSVRIVPTWMLVNVQTGERYRPQGRPQKLSKKTVVKGRVKRPRLKVRARIKARIA